MKNLSAGVVAALVALSVGIIGAATLAVFGETPKTLYERYDSSKHHVVTFDPGGSVFQRVDDLTKSRLNGDTYQIEGWCISACTYILGFIPRENICASPYARFGFHEVALMNMMTGVRTPKMPETLWIKETYMPDVLKILKYEGWDFDGPVPEDQPFALYWLSGEQIGIKTCD